jgi:hypothetical protein
LGVLVLGIVALDPNGPLLSSFWLAGNNDLRLLMDEILIRQEQGKQLRDAFDRRREAKRQVAEEVIAGRLNLAEALEAFRSLQSERLLLDEPKEDVLKRWKMSEDEWLGVGVLDYVKQVLADRPYEAAVVIARLKKELQELLADRKKRPPVPVEKPIERSR